MEENFDIDKHIDKIKKQMEQTESTNEPSQEDIEQDILASVPSDEPPLENYADNKDETVDSAFEQGSSQIYNDFETGSYNTEWSDPFGTNENDAVKKYVIYISKDFVPYIDNMDKDARSAYVNEAIQLKIDLEGKDKKWHLFKRILRHVLVSIFTLIIAVPALFWLADKSITATVQNYGYVQKNFEKLYKDKIERERAVKEIQQMRLGL